MTETTFSRSLVQRSRSQKLFPAEACRSAVRVENRLLVLTCVNNRLLAGGVLIQARLLDGLGSGNHRKSGVWRKWQDSLSAWRWKVDQRPCARLARLVLFSLTWTLNLYCQLGVFLYYCDEKRTMLCKQLHWLTHIVVGVVIEKDSVNKILAWMWVESCVCVAASRQKSTTKHGFS